MASDNPGRFDLARWLAALSMGLRPYVLLTLMCAFVFLPALSTLPPMDRDEARFMQATKQMVETGDYVHIRFQNEPRNKKPVGIYWLQAAAVNLSGITDLATPWIYRLPSVLAAWLAVLVTCAAGRRWFGNVDGLMAGTILSTCLITVFEAHMAKTDATLLAATTVAMTALMIAYLQGAASTLRPAVVFWFALGVGVLIKGPVILLVAGATIATLCIADRDIRWLRRLHPLYGVPVALLVVLPWLIAISSDIQGNFVADALRGDILPKLIGGQESHGAIPGTHLASALATAWPWSLLAPFVLVAAWRKRTEPVVRFLLAWLVPGWIAFELIPTKLPHYTLPLFPAFALLTAALVSDAGALFAQGAGKVYRALWAISALVIAGAVVYFARLFGDGSATPGTPGCGARRRRRSPVCCVWRKPRAHGRARAVPCAGRACIGACPDRRHRATPDSVRTRAAHCRGRRPPRRARAGERRGLP